MFSKITLMIGFMLLSTGALQAQDKPELEIGGAVLNYNLSSWKEGQKNAEVILICVFRINAKPKELS
jgi:hypothetical protein